MCTRLALCCLALLFSGCNPQSEQPAPSRAEMARLEADVRFLADDALEGREAGTRGYDLAALYVAERFRAIGLRPGGNDDSYYQTVPMLEVEPGKNGKPHDWRHRTCPGRRLPGFSFIQGRDDRHKCTARLRRHVFRFGAPWPRRFRGAQPERKNRGVHARGTEVLEQ